MPAVVLKSVPVIVTEVPTGPELGVKLLIVGTTIGGVTVKSAALVAICPATSTVITPVVAPVGTVVTMLVDVGVPLIVATTPLNFTILLPGMMLKSVPDMVTEIPTCPEIGLKPVTVGGLMTVN